jgi:ABC-type amino acid transport substrate-binding protein
VDQGLLDLQAGRVDIYLTDNVPAETYAKEMGGMKIITLPDIFEVKTVNIIVHEGDAELTSALNDVIAELKAEGYIAELEQTWLYGE